MATVGDRFCGPPPFFYLFQRLRFVNASFVRTHHGHDKYFALRSAENVFMTGAYVDDGKLYLNFHKRLLADFRVLSSCIVIVEDPVLFSSSNRGVFSVVAVDEDEAGSSNTLLMDSEDRTVAIRTKEPCRK